MKWRHKSFSGHDSVARYFHPEVQACAFLTKKGLAPNQALITHAHDSYRRDIVTVYYVGEDEEPQDAEPLTREDIDRYLEYTGAPPRGA